MVAKREVLPIIDCDVHQGINGPNDLYPYLPRAYREEIEQFGLRVGPAVGGYPNGGVRGMRGDAWTQDGRMASTDLDLMREQLLDKYPIEYAILGHDVYLISNLPNADYAAALASAYNDWMIEHWLEEDDRLKGLVLIATQIPQQAAKEIERVASHKDIVGVVVQNGARYPYGQRFYDPIFEVCNDMELPFVVHVAAEGLSPFGTPTPAGYPSYYIEYRQARAMGYQAHLASMIFEGLFHRFPKLKVAYVEGGYVWLPAFLWRLDSDWRALRDQTPWVTRPPSEYVFEHCRFTSQPMETGEGPKSLLTIFEWARADRTLMFASDYAHFDFDSPEQSLPPMPAELRRRVFYETAQELFKLRERVHAGMTE